MKFKIIWIPLLIIVFSFPSICFSEPPNLQIWKSLEYNLYYNIKIITTPSNTMLVWTYRTVTDDIRKMKIEEAKKYDLAKSIKYQQYHHEVILWEIDCKEKRWRLKDYINFDNDENILDRYTYNNREWKSIPPDSMMDTLYQKVCVTQKTPLKKKK